MMSGIQTCGFSFTSRFKKVEVDPIYALNILVLAIGISILAAGANRFGLINLALYDFMVVRSGKRASCRSSDRVSSPTPIISHTASLPTSTGMPFSRWT